MADVPLRGALGRLSFLGWGAKIENERIDDRRDGDGDRRVARDPTPRVEVPSSARAAVAAENREADATARAETEAAAKDDSSPLSSKSKGGDDDDDGGKGGNVVPVDRVTFDVIDDREREDTRRNRNRDPDHVRERDFQVRRDTKDGGGGRDRDDDEEKDDDGKDDEKDTKDDTRDDTRDETKDDTRDEKEEEEKDDGGKGDDPSRPCSASLDLPSCAVFFRSSGGAEFAFRAGGNPLIPPGQPGSCCTVRVKKETPCGHCCGHVCPRGLVPKFPVVTSFRGEATDEICCEEGTMRPVPADVVLAVDYSWSVQRYPVHLAEELRFAEGIVERLLGSNPTVPGGGARGGDDPGPRFKVGVLGFSGRVEWKHGLTSRASDLAMTKSGASLVAAKGHGATTALIPASKCAMDPAKGRGFPTFTDEAIDAARAELAGPRSRPGAKKILLLLTDGAPWPQVQHRRGMYAGKGNRVVKALDAASRFRSAGYEIVYVSVHSDDPKRYPSFTTLDVASGVPTFSWQYGGDSNRILAMCLFDDSLCSPAVRKYGAAYVDSDDGDERNSGEIVRWTEDPFPGKFPSSPTDTRITGTFTTHGKQETTYRHATPKEGMSRFQYTDLAWRRQQVLWRRLARDPARLGEFEARTISIGGFEDLARRLATFVEMSAAAVDRAARVAERKG